MLRSSLASLLLVVLAGQVDAQAVVHSEAMVQAVAFSADGKWLVTGNSDKSARLWDVATGKELRSFQEDGPVRAVALSADGKWLVTATGSTVRSWDLATGKQGRLFNRGMAGQVQSLALSADGKYLATGGYGQDNPRNPLDDTVRLWELATGVEVRTFKGYSGGDNSVAISGDGKLLAFASENGCRLFDLLAVPAKPVEGFATTDRNKALQWLKKELEAVKDNQLLVNEVAAKIIGQDVQWEFTVKQIDAEGKDAIIRLLPFTAKNLKYDFYFGRPMLANESRAPGGTMNPRVARPGAFPKPDNPGNRPTTNDTNQILVSDLDFAKKVRGGSTIIIHGKIMNSSEAFEKPTNVSELISLRAIRVDLLAEGSGSKVLTSTPLYPLWDLNTHEESRSFHGHTQRVQSVAFSGDGKWLVTGSSDRTARLWDVASGKEVRSYSVNGAILSVTLSTDGKWLVTRSVDNLSVPFSRVQPRPSAQSRVTVRLWDVATGKEVRSFEGPGQIWSVALSTDGKWLVTGGRDNTARLWDVDKGKEVRAFAAP